MFHLKKQKQKTGYEGNHCPKHMIYRRGRGPPGGAHTRRHAHPDAHAHAGMPRRKRTVPTRLHRPPGS